MAYKKRLSKNKIWTGKELGQLELANYVYMYEHRADEDTNIPKTIFNLKTFIEICQDLAEKNPEEYALYLGYQNIVRWLGKYSNVMWGYNSTLDMCIEAIDARLGEAYMLAVMEYSKGAAAAAGLEEIEALLAATPKEAGGWHNEDTTQQRLEDIHDATNGFMWIALDSYFGIKAYNKALEILAAKYEVPELEGFGIVLSDREEDMECLKESAEKLEALRQRLALKDLEEPLQNIIFDIINMPDYTKWECYTEESIAETKKLLEVDEGLNSFYGGIFMETLYKNPLDFMREGGRP